MDLFDLVTMAINEDIVWAVRENVPKQDRMIVEEAAKILHEFATHCWDLQEQRKAQRQQSLLWKLYKKSRWGFIYIMHLWDGIYKIGKSIQPQDRLSDIRRGVREYIGEQKDIEIIHQIKTPDMHWAEKELHKRYKHNQEEIPPPIGWSRLTSGEMFKLHDREITQIQIIKIMMPPQFIDIKDKIIAEGKFPLSGVEWGTYA